MVERGRILYDLSSGALTAEAGIFELAFRIFDEEGDEVATPMITCNVYDVARNTAAVASTDEFSVLQDFIKNINDVDTRLDATDSLHNLISTSVIEIYGENFSGNEYWKTQAIALPEYGVENIDDYDYIALLVPMDYTTLELSQRMELAVQRVRFVDGILTAEIRAEGSAYDPEYEEPMLTYMCIRILKEAGKKGDGMQTASFVGVAQFPNAIDNMVRINNITIPVSQWQDSDPYSAMVYPPAWGDLYDWQNKRNCVATFYPLDKETLAESQRMELEVSAIKYGSGMTWATVARNDHIPSVDLRYACVMTAVDDPTGSAPAEIATYIAGVTKIPDDVWQSEVKQVVDAMYPRISVGVHTIASGQWSDSDPLRADLLTTDFDDHSIVLLIPLDADTRRESQRIEVTVHSYSGGDAYGHIWLLASQSYPPPTLTYESLIIKMPDPFPDGFVPTAAIVGVSELSNDYMDREVLSSIDRNLEAIAEKVLGQMPVYNGEVADA